MFILGPSKAASQIDPAFVDDAGVGTPVGLAGGVVGLVGLAAVRPGEDPVDSYVAHLTAPILPVGLVDELQLLLPDRDHVVGKLRRRGNTRSVRSAPDEVAYSQVKNP